MMLGAHGANGPGIKVWLVQVGHDVRMWITVADWTRKYYINDLEIPLS
jgi:hypothetical protein